MSAPVVVSYCCDAPCSKVGDHYYRCPTCQKFFTSRGAATLDPDTIRSHCCKAPCVQIKGRSRCSTCKKNPDRALLREEIIYWSPFIPALVWGIAELAQVMT